jgi:hypothetical protein
VTPEQRKEWEAIRYKGYHYFLLLHGFTQVLISWILFTLLIWYEQYGFSLSALKTIGFWGWAIFSLVALNSGFGFKKMFVWRKKEYEYLAEANSGESSPMK